MPADTKRNPWDRGRSAERLLVHILLSHYRKLWPGEKGLATGSKAQMPSASPHSMAEFSKTNTRLARRKVPETRSRHEV